ncbi:MAG TPA: 30S ribosomal protein S16 [Pedobacter sp.]|nr:30S ribosomal protein S16 [Pedobacter sp.]
MATKIRLQRFGKKGKPFFHVVVADSRSPRDGKFIERLGSYNPNTNPATIDLNFDKTLDWVNKGAEPTDTCRAILSYKGVLYKKHLEGGVKKGALTAEQADAKFAEWLGAKDGRIEGKKDSLTKSKDEVKKAALAAEAKKNADRAAALAIKNAPVEEVVEEEPAAEAVTEEAPAAEVTEEAPVAEAAIEEAPVAETTEEAPAAEATTEESKEENA